MRNSLVRPLSCVAIAAEFSSPSAQAVTIAIIDSGVDYEHDDLAPRIWDTSTDVMDNGLDDDDNGFIDDHYGWNFADGNNKVIDREYLDRFSEDCYRFFEVQGRIVSGSATSDERKWYDEKKGDAAFIGELASFGNFVHGSHVAGIASASRSVERILTAKVIATKAPGEAGRQDAAAREALAAVDPSEPTSPISPISRTLIRKSIDTLVDRQVGAVVKAGAYVAAKDVDVANGSFGVSYASAEQSVTALLKLAFGKEPTEDQIKEFATYMIDRINQKCLDFVSKAENTLFVFAAGNSGTDNDEQAMAPANVGAANSLSVAATLGLRSLATFSNFGVKKVDVAAPVVVINSTVPGNRYLPMSGTSMAAPYVTQVAALIKDRNPDLSPPEIKRIIMDTVDRKSWLASKVRAGGTVNEQRAVKAAELSRTHDVDAAISLASSSVGDAVESVESAGALSDKGLYVVPLPSLL